MLGNKIHELKIRITIQQAKVALCKTKATNVLLQTTEKDRITSTEDANDSKYSKNYGIWNVFIPHTSAL